MDTETKQILKLIGIEFNELQELDGLLICREQFLSSSKYDEIKGLIYNLKHNYSSSVMTSLHKNAIVTQKWPLLNLIRQILNVYYYKMIPIRKANGYTLDGIKKYTRFFQLKKRAFIKKEINNLLE